MNNKVKYELKFKSSHLDDLINRKKATYKRSIMIDEDVVNYFRKEGYKLGVTHGLLINALLRDFMDKWNHQN